MKRSQLNKLIKECINEVLQEMTTSTPSYDTQTGDITGTIKISKSDPQKTQKIQAASTNKQTYELYEDDTLNQKPVNEMARIPTLYKLGPNARNIADPKLANSSIVQKWVNFIDDNGPSSIIDVANKAFDTPKRQQQINPLIPMLTTLGVLEPMGLRHEPKNPTTVEPEHKFDDETGEELYNDDADSRYDSVEDEFVGFASKYDKKPWQYRDEDDIVDAGGDDMVSDIPPVSPEVDPEFAPVIDREPTSGELDRPEDLLKMLDREEDEPEEDMFEEKDVWQRRAGIKY